MSALANFLTSDVRTLASARASVGQKILAAVSIASCFLPEARGSVGAVEFTGKVLSQIAHGADAYHSFGPLIDKEVVSGGKLTIKSDGYHMFTLKGRVNGVSGDYEIGGYVKNGTLAGC